MNRGNIIVFSKKSNDGQMALKEGKASKIRNGSTSPIKYEIFQYFSKYAENIGELTWKDVFENASHDSFKKGYRFNGITLSIQLKNKVFRRHDVVINQNDPNGFINAYNECKEFITETSGCISQSDENDTLIFDEKQVTEVKGWSGNIPPKYQISMIRAFTKECSIYWKLSDKKLEELNENIIGMLYCGDITPSDITCENYKIKAIQGLTFSVGEFYIVTKVFNMPKKIKFNGEKKK